MNIKVFAVATLSAIAMGTSVPLMAAPADSGDANVAQQAATGTRQPMMPNPMMRGEAGPRHMAGAGKGGHGIGMGGMMGMGGGMMGPMMGACESMDPATAMRMRGEMMRAMGDILIKYADQAGSGAQD